MVRIIYHNHYKYNI